MGKKKRGGEIKECVDGEEKTPENLLRLKVLGNLLNSAKNLSSGLVGVVILDFIWKLGHGLPR